MQTKQSMYHNDVDIRSCNNGPAHNLSKLRLFSTPPMMANHWCSMLFALDRGVFTPLNIMNRARMDLNQTDHFCGWRMVILVLQIWPSAEEGFTFLDNIQWKPQKKISRHTWKSIHFLCLRCSILAATAVRMWLLRFVVDIFQRHSVVWREDTNTNKD